MKYSRSLKTILIEVFSIVLGVMLALGVSEWQQEREYAQLADTALANVARELESNLEVLTRITPLARCFSTKAWVNQNS